MRPLRSVIVPDGGGDGRGEGEVANRALVMGTPRSQAFIAEDEAAWPFEQPPWESEAAVEDTNGRVAIRHHGSPVVICAWWFMYLAHTTSNLDGDMGRN